MAEHRIALSEARLNDAQRIAKVGSWEWKLATREEWWSNELYRILEEDPNTYEASFRNFLAKVHPDDRRGLAAGVENVGAMRGGAVIGPTTIRIMLGEGRRKTVELRFEVRPDEQGRPSTVIGTLHDVTERWELEKQLQESEERYASTVELAAIGIAHVNLGGRFMWTNKRLCEMLGYAKEELLGLTIWDVSHPDDMHITDEHRAKLHAGVIGSLTSEKRYIRKNGTTMWVRITSTLKRNAEGGPLHDISIVEDITDRKAVEARIQYLATHDEMTGLLNRATFGELLSHTIDATGRRGGKCAVLFIDLDGFKVINDSLGHEAGDLLLKEMAMRLRGCMRKSDSVARLGGDEFVVLLEDSDGAAAAEAARKILVAVIDPIEIMGQECRVSASIGIARYPDDACDDATLMKCADVAMYLAKEAGKNTSALFRAGARPVEPANQ
ncbi:MAG TPA: diguanylate cyclase [Gammaproteobacteria bacterium]|nr:diguanylate cyclase [Gammaproteobacteria bacterium]